MGPVARLENTWSEFGEKHPKCKIGMVEINLAFNDLSNIVSARYQYSNYRKFMKSCQFPALPFLGVYLTDLTFLELGNPDFLPNSDCINFSKRRKVYRLVEEIKKFQKTPFSYPVVPQIQEFLVKQIKGDDDSTMEWDKKFVSSKAELYQKSLEHEPLKMDSSERDSD